MEFFFENNAINLCKSEYKQHKHSDEKEPIAEKKEDVHKIKTGILGPLVDLFFLLDHDQNNLIEPADIRASFTKFDLDTNNRISRVELQGLSNILEGLCY
jgi:hypothetical protein